jgi:hypothetical protein
MRKLSGLHIWLNPYEHMDIITKAFEVLEAPCGNGEWHIKRCPPILHV